MRPRTRLMIVAACQVSLVASCAVAGKPVPIAPALTALKPTNPSPTALSPTALKPTNPSPTNPSPSNPSPTNPSLSNPSPTNPSLSNPSPTVQAPTELPATGLTPTLPLPAGAATPARATLRTALAPLAKLTYAAARVQLLSNRAAGVVSNHAGSLVANNAAGVVGNFGALYRQATIAGFRLLADPVGAGGARPGERYLGRTQRPDGAFVDSYAVGVGETRDVVSTADGTRVMEEHTTGIVYHANEAFKEGRTVRRLYGPDGAESAVLTYQEAYDDAGVFTSLTYAPSTFKVPGTSIDVAIEALTLDAVQRRGTFRTRFRHLGLVEAGTVADVTRGPGGAIAFNMVDPLDLWSGTSQVTDEAGAVQFARSQRVEAGTQRLGVELRDGWTLELQRKSPRDGFTGRAMLKGTPAGEADFRREADGGVRIRVGPANGEPAIELEEGGPS